MFNLISNAIRYGGDGKYLGMFLRADQAHIYIDIVDRGRGIEKEFAASVFDTTVYNGRSRIAPCKEMVLV